MPSPNAFDDPYRLADPDVTPSGPRSAAGREPKAGAEPGSGVVFAMSSLSGRDFAIYVGAIVVMILVALSVRGEEKILCAAFAGLVCMGPFLATGFAQRYGVPFRDGIVSGLMYIFVMPYRIHYRMTHRVEFARIELPKFARRDLVPLALTVPSLGVLLLGAQEADEMRKAPRRNPVVAQRSFAPPAEDQPATPKRPIEEARRKAARAELKGPGARKAAKTETAATEAEDRRSARSKAATQRSLAKHEATPSSSSADERQAIDRDVRAWAEGLVAVLESVVDVPTARDAVPRLRAIDQAFDEDQARLDRLANLPVVHDPKARASHEEALRAAVARYADETARVASIPGVDAILTRDVLAIRPFLPGTTIRIALATPKPAIPAPSPPATSTGPGGAVTINVGSVDGPTSKAINDVLMERLKAGGGNWSLRSNAAGGRTWFTVSPVDDVQAFADGLAFAREAKVSGRTIDVVVDRTRLAVGAK